jgi:hypothetical protein
MEWSGSDDELAALALADDPAAADQVAADAVCLWDVIDADPIGRSLPEWYMPATNGPTRQLRRGWRRVAVWMVIASFFAIDACGLCSTYGQIVFA